MSPEKSLQVSSARFFRKAKYGLDKFVLIGKRKIHYVEAGQGDPIILIPGSGSTFARSFICWVVAVADPSQFVCMPSEA